MKHSRKNILYLFLYFSSCIVTYSQTAPTWADNIACIFYSHCTSCHNPNGIAPFSLLEYDTAFAHSDNILAYVTTKKMPPWPSDESYQQHSFANVLTQEEITQIQDWVNEGAPSGNLTNAPAKPIYTSKSKLIKTSISLTTPKYTLSSSYDDWQCFAFKSPIGVDTYIKSWEIITSNHQAVHHVEIYSDSSAASYTADTSTTAPGYPAQIPVSGGLRAYKGVGVPGSSLYSYPVGLGSKLPKNATISLAVHFSPDRINDTTRIQLNLVIDSLPNRNVENDWVFGPSDLVNGPFFIKADTIITFYGSAPIKNDLTYISVTPHMHYLGKSFKVFVVTDINDTIKLVDIPDWDFHWQMTYFFPKPLKIPSNSFLHAEVTYDNTTGNSNNPNSPPIDVSVGMGSKDEMLVIYMGQTDYMAGDEDIIVDTTSHINHNLYCFSTGVDENEKLISDFIIYPNPSSSDILISTSRKKYFVEIGNGINTIDKKELYLSNRIEFIKYASGIYFISFYDEQKQYIETKKIIICK